MLGAIQRGLTLQDFEMLTVGMLIDYVVAYNDVTTPQDNFQRAETVRVRPASQQDYDRF